MTNLNDREKTIENLFGHKEELRMKIKAKAYYKLGLWISELLGLASKQEVEKYALNMVTYELDPKNKVNLFDKIINDLKIRNIYLDKYTIQDKFDLYASEARNELMGTEGE